MPSHTFTERRKRNPKGKSFGKLGAGAKRKKFEKKRLARLSAKSR